MRNFLFLNILRLYYLKTTKKSEDLVWIKQICYDGLRIGPVATGLFV